MNCLSFNDYPIKSDISQLTKFQSAKILNIDHTLKKISIKNYAL